MRRHEEEEKKLRAELADSRLEAEAASRTGQAIAGELERAREEAEELRAFHESEAAELTRQAALLKEELAKRSEEWAQQVRVPIRVLHFVISRCDCLCAIGGSL